MTVICTDKTGTLTKSEMQVVDVYADQISYDVHEKDSAQQISQTLLEISIGCNKA